MTNTSPAPAPRWRGLWLAGVTGAMAAITLTVLIGLMGRSPAYAASGAATNAAAAARGPSGGFATSQPNQDLIVFLKSPAGAVIGGLLTLSAGLGVGAITCGRLRDRPRETRSKKRRRSGGKAHGPSERASSSRAPAHATIIAATVVAACFLLPLVFTIAFADVFAQPKTWFLWAFAAVVALTMLWAASKGARPIGSSLTDLAAAAFVLFNLVATIFSTDPLHSLIGERLQYQGFLSIAAYVVLFYGARYAIAGAIQVRALALALVVSGVAVALYGLVQWFGLDPIWSDLWKGRIFSTMGQANMLAAFLGTAVVMMIPLANTGGRIRRSILIGSALVMGLTLALTFSRGGYLALVAGLVVGGAVQLRGMRPQNIRRYAPRAGAAAVVVLVASGATALAWRPAGDLVSQVAGRAATIADTSESSNRIRLDLWTVAVDVAAQHPLFGTGPDSYVLVFPDYRDASLPPQRAQHLAQFRVESPHNVYLATAAGAGLPALLALLVLVGGSLWLGGRAAWGQMEGRDRLALAGLMAGTTVVLVANAFMTAEPATSAIGFILMGALVGVASNLVLATEAS